MWPARHGVCLFVCLFLARQPPVGHGPLIHDVSRSHTKTHHIRQDSSRRVITSSQRPLPDNTQHSQQTDFHAPGGIRTHSLSRRATAEVPLRSHGHWDRLRCIVAIFSSSHAAGRGVSWTSLRVLSISYPSVWGSSCNFNPAVTEALIKIYTSRGSFRFLWQCIVSKVWREKTNKMQQLDVYY